MKLIKLPHKVCPMTCMVNGLEDLYEAKTGTRLPDQFLLFMSGMAGFTYLKLSKAPVQRFVLWGPRPTAQYDVLGEAVGFTWTTCEGRGFAYALKQAQTFIDQGTPVILGALDMYHLPYYPKLYHTIHVPIHFVLMVGYDEERRVVLVQDCDRPDVQEVPCTDLQLAWDVRTPGYSERNTLFAFRFNGEVADVLTIAERALRRKAEFMLRPPTSMFGIPGIRKLARELPAWPDQLAPEALRTSLYTLAEYTGHPPTLPNRLTGYTDAPDRHDAGRGGLADVLIQLAQSYQRPAWAEAANLFRQSGQVVRDFTDAIVDHLLGEDRTLAQAATLVDEIADLEAQAYQLVAVGIEMSVSQASMT
jgi:hypothetical protein